MSKENLFKNVANLAPKYQKVWADICAIESPTAHKAGVDAVGNYFIEIANQLGFDVQILAQQKSGNVVCIEMNKNANAKPICLSAHMDTVFPLGTLEKTPVRIEGDKIYAPGASDCKGGLALAMMIMEGLQSVGYDKRPIRFLLQSDEENGSIFSNKQTINYICEKAKDSVAFLNLEGGENGVVCLQRKGILNFVLTVTGKEAHSSFCAVEGANAICEMAHKIIELEKLKDDKGITCNCGVIQGGTVRNTVAGSCKLKVNIRFATEEQRIKANEYVKQVASQIHVEGCACSVLLESERVAMELTERNLKLLDKMNEIFAKNGFSTFKAGSRRGGSDAADITLKGIPVVDKLGPVGEGIHTINEYAYLGSLSERAQRLATFIYCFDDVN